jgi:hypothetical protein
MFAKQLGNGDFGQAKDGGGLDDFFSPTPPSLNFSLLPLPQVLFHKRLP